VPRHGIEETDHRLDDGIVARDQGGSILMRIQDQKQTLVDLHRPTGGRVGEVQCMSLLAKV